MSRKYATVLKWVWIAGVLAVCLHIIWRSRADISKVLDEMSQTFLAVSLVSMVLAKLLLGENARMAAGRALLVMDYWTAARLYNMSQLGKYLPGSVWQFVGRAAAYRHLGADYRQIRDSLLVETAWVIAGASVLALLLSGPAVIVVVHDGLSTAMRWWLAAIIASLVIGAITFLLARRSAFIRLMRIGVPTLGVLLVQVGIWTLLGLSFWLLAQACGIEAGLLFSIGLFSAAYAAGFLVPFAPAGLGVRDGILVVGLLPYATSGEAVAVTVLARLTYLLVELLLVVTQEALLAAHRLRNAH